VLVLAIYAKLKMQIKHMPILIWLSIINIGYMSVFVTHWFFLSSRFAMPIALFMALPASFALARVFEKTDISSWKTRSIKSMSIFLLLFMLLDGLISTGDSKRYIRNAGYWLEQSLKPGETLLTNIFAVNHYANIRMGREDRARVLRFAKQLDNNEITKNSINTADFIAIRTKHVAPGAIDRISELLEQQPVKEFSQSSKEKIIIFHRQ
jgi:hypothetical protein